MGTGLEQHVEVSLFDARVAHAPVITTPAAPAARLTSTPSSPPEMRATTCSSRVVLPALQTRTVSHGHGQRGEIGASSAATALVNDTEFSKDSAINLTLTPSGPLMDSPAGKPLTDPIAPLSSPQP